MGWLIQLGVLKNWQIHGVRWWLSFLLVVSWVRMVMGLGVVKCLLGGVGVPVVLEGPSSVVHFKKNNLAAVEGL